MLLGKEGSTNKTAKQASVATPVSQKSTPAKTSGNQKQGFPSKVCWQPFVFYKSLGNSNIYVFFILSLNFELLLYVLFLNKSLDEVFCNLLSRIDL